MVTLNIMEKSGLASLLPSDWKKISDVDASDGDRMDVLPFIKTGEIVSGAEMIKRAKKMGGLTGSAHCNYLLANQDEIPEDWQKYVLIFAGCQREDSQGNQFVLYLSFNERENCWRLSFHLLNYALSNRCRLVCLLTQ